MKKVIIYLALVLFIGGSWVPAFGWQGRMAGMGDPYGLIEDESDFLVHPTKIAGPGSATGLKWYAHYGFMYGKVTDWDWTMDLLSPIMFLGAPIALPPGTWGSVSMRHDGEEFKHDGLLGATFPVGVGRMGIFFTYKGKRGDYDGSTLFTGGIPGTAVSAIFNNDLESDLDDFALRAIYGLPITKNFKLGAEFQMGYQRDENRFSTAFRDVLLNGTSLIPAGVTVNFTTHNDPLGLYFPFMLPHDSRFWELASKIGLEGRLGAFDVGVTLRGGAIVAGDNEWDHSLNFALNVPGIFSVDALHRYNMDGDISGWRFGGDIWVRAKLSESLSLPFLVRADYQTRRREGADTGIFSVNVPTLGVVFNLPLLWRYDNDESRFAVEVGGGLDWVPSKGTRIGAGLYYNYLYSKDELFVAVSPQPLPFVSVGNDFGEIPTSREHQAKLRLTAEMELAPTFVLRGGLQSFVGWVKQDFRSTLNVYSAGPGLSLVSAQTSPDGLHWGVMGGLGASAKFSGVTLEPFVTGGYQELNLDGDARTNLLGGVVQVPWDLEKDRREWLIGGGLSILFGP